jgi:hypothetical protein
MRSRALVTYADEGQQDILEISMPFKEYLAESFGYQLISDQKPDLQGRSSYWAKVALLRQLLGDFEELIWLDADTMPVDFSEDIFSHLDEDCFQGFVVERLRWRFNPNVGVWAIRNNDIAQEFLDSVWAEGPLQEHIWPDQAAILKSLGWKIHPFPRGIKIYDSNRYLQQTGWLPPEWNHIVGVDGESPKWKTKILHWAGGKDNRRELMLAASKQYRRLLSQPR